MKISVEDTKPIYMQIAENIEDEILTGLLKEGEQAPSTNQFAQFFQINPATAAKGVNLLVEEGILFKKRGIGMFVAAGAKQQIIEKRKTRFANEYLYPMVKEADKLKIPLEEIKAMIERIKEEEHNGTGN